MLAIRMQRTGRSGHAMFRVVVQDSRLTPTSGKVVAAIGSYDPHAKSVIIDKEKASYYLEHGAQPSDSIVRLFTREGVSLPKWVTMSEEKKRNVKNPDKRRSTSPKPEVDEAPAEQEASTEAAEPEVTTEPAVEATEPAAAPAEVEATEATSEAAEEK